MKSVLLFINLLFSIVLSYSTIAQTVTNIDFNTANWVLPEKYQIVEFEEKQSLLLERTDVDDFACYLAYLKDYEFTNGIIEFDLFCPQDNRAFFGFLFRLNTYNEEDRYELFYFRAHISNQIRSVQYMPVNNGFEHWPDYLDFVYNSIGEIPCNEWIHVKADIEGPRAIVYVNDKEVMTVDNLGRGLSSGSVGVWLGNTPKCYYADFKVTKKEEIQ